MDVTQAYGLTGVPPKDVAEERRGHLLALQGEIIAELQQARVGESVEVLVDEVGECGIEGRSHADAPEVDCLVRAPSGKRLEAGGAKRVQNGADYPCPGAGKRARRSPGQPVESGGRRHLFLTARVVGGKVGLRPAGKAFRRRGGVTRRGHGCG